MDARDHLRLLEDLIDRVITVQQEQANLNRRVSNIIRPARVTKVDADKYTHRVAYTVDENGQDVETTDIKWAARAGKIKDWSPPTVGEQVFLISPSGDINENSFTMAGGFTDTFKPNHDKEGEQKMTVDTGQQGGKQSIVLTKADSQTTSTQTLNSNAETMNDTAGRINHLKGGEVAV
ncbi:phage baseplate assembly protein V [Hyphomicrobium sp.]|uniref:phage baseplate assembly protein V n=1 Tax=Hyphomicrobium sp. TaxID=82 RepID=UPI001D920BFA|nr:phage baseplate assembly protein V [Hyphomicrobium sp.]MBY0559867.1 phage baseplate assembly protein V [Hyphomicrobium sp.]